MKIIKVLIGFAVMLTLVAGCEKKQTEQKPIEEKSAAVAKTGITDDAIKIGQWGPQTGPAALWGAIARGTDAYFKMINDAGGIHGRKLELLIRDDSYQPAKTKASVMELVEKEGVFAFVGGVGTGPGMAVKSYLEEKKIPWIGPASGSSHWAKTANRYLFSLYPTYEMEAKALVRYLLDNAKAEKIAFFYQNDDYGKEGLEAARAELKLHGKELVAAVSVEMADADLSSHVLKLKEAAPDTVMLWLLPKHAAITLKTAAKLDFKPRWVTTSTLSDAPLMHHITGGLWDGVIFNSIMQLPDSDHPLVQKYKAAYEKYGLAENEQEKWGIFFMAGFMFAEPFVEALKLAGRDLDREKLVDALETLNKWNGGVGHDITFNPNERQGQKSVFICQCENGRAVKITDWLTE
jgi:branched-chain amino acid transport system substrate-binding protein